MCGRFTLTASREALHNLFPLFDVPALDPRYNVAPTQSVLAVRVPPADDQPAPALLRWGLIPAWAADPKKARQPINARAETAAELPTFRVAFRRRRCLIVADGFYEWQKTTGKHKQPYYFRLKDGSPFAFAGLWERWERGGEPIDSCAILTTTANELVRPVHERMPVMLSPQDFDVWLDPKAQQGPALQALLRPYPAEQMTAYPVTARVNNPRQDDAACLLPLAG
jgi:putative SOS response-associated peptidase YedK